MYCQTPLKIPLRQYSSESAEKLDAGALHGLTPRSGGDAAPRAEDAGAPARGAHGPLGIGAVAAGKAPAHRHALVLVLGLRARLVRARVTVAVTFVVGALVVVVPVDALHCELVAAGRLELALGQHRGLARVDLDLLREDVSVDDAAHQVAARRHRESERVARPDGNIRDGHAARQVDDFERRLGARDLEGARARRQHGEDDVLTATQREVEARVLRCARQARALAHRVLLGVVEGLRECDVAVACAIGGPEQAGREVVREERTVHVDGLVRVL